MRSLNIYMLFHKASIIKIGKEYKLNVFLEAFVKLITLIMFQF